MIKVKMSEHLNNKQVLHSWRVSRPAKAGSLQTNGNSLYSNQLEIGFTDERGAKVLIDYTASGGEFISYKTSHYVGVARHFADKVFKPFHARHDETMQVVGRSIVSDFIAYKESKRHFRELAGLV